MTAGDDIVEHVRKAISVIRRPDGHVPVSLVRRLLAETDSLRAAAAVDRAFFNSVTLVAGPIPIPLLLTCPLCCKRHVDRNEWATKAHHTHACQYCGHVWRPAIQPTVGVQFLPGFKDQL